MLSLAMLGFAECSMRRWKPLRDVSAVLVVHGLSAGV